MEEKVRQEPGMSNEMFPRVENGMRNGEKRKVERGPQCFLVGGFLTFL